MSSTSELVDGSEPHGCIWYTARTGVAESVSTGAGGEVYPGWAGMGAGRVLYRVLTRVQPGLWTLDLTLDLDPGSDPDWLLTGPETDLKNPKLSDIPV